jgi:hypothetical protein
MAKTEDDLAKSQEERARVKHLLGCIPESILLHDKSDQAMDLLVEEDGRDYTSTFHQPKKVATEFGKITEAERLKASFYLSGAGARWGALSRFPQNVGRILLKLYSREPYCSVCRESLDVCEHDPSERKVCHDTVVDPFAGHNSRMQLCYKSRRNYIGCDISHRFMEANFKLRDKLLTANAGDMFASENTAEITLHECDSRKMEPVKNSVGDFTITSPPYWDLEYYGDEMGQLGKDNDYHEFLRRLGMVAHANFRCLKSGAFCVWCINDFRKDGKFYSYHVDTHRLLKDAGFKQHDCAIIDLGGSFGQAFASQIVENKILPKRHEYALIFRKP